MRLLRLCAGCFEVVLVRAAQWACSDPAEAHPFVRGHLTDGADTPSQARERMVKSTVVDSKTGGSIDSEVRTSTGTFYTRGQDEVGAVSRRMCA